MQQAHHSNVDRPCEMCLAAAGPSVRLSVCLRVCCRSGLPPLADEEDPITPTAQHNGAAGDTDEELGMAGDAAGSPDTHGSSSLAMRSASAMKQIRAPLEALFKRRASTTPGVHAREAGEGGSLSAGGGLPAGLDARRAALLATLQGAGGGLGAGKYVVEVDHSGEWGLCCRPGTLRCGALGVAGECPCAMHQAAGGCFFGGGGGAGCGPGSSCDMALCLCLFVWLHVVFVQAR